LAANEDTLLVTTSLEILHHLGYCNSCLNASLYMQHSIYDRSTETSNTKAHNHMCTIRIK